MKMLTGTIILISMVGGRADNSCHDKFMKSIQYQLKLFGDQSCTGTSHHERRRIGFSATSSKDQSNVAKNSVVVFDKILSNDGNSYNPQNGIFTAPVEGLYQFSWTVVAYGKKTFVTFLEWNGQVIGRNNAWSDSAWAGSASQTLALHLKYGDKVNIKTSYEKQYMHGDLWSIFTGVLIA